jgi:hypothetical protein
MRDAAGMPAGAETGLTGEELVYRRRGRGTRAASTTKLSGEAARIPAEAIGPIPVRGGSGVQFTNGSGGGSLDFPGGGDPGDGPGDLGPVSIFSMRDLLTGDVEGAPFGQSGMDRLTGKDALREARLNEVIFGTVHDQAGLLFDLRGALQLRMA